MTTWTGTASPAKSMRRSLLEVRRKENDLTLDAIAERLLRTHGVEADKSMLSRFFAAEVNRTSRACSTPRARRLIGESES
jgi:hypothetical protein